jgi:hypothetical protein
MKKSIKAKVVAGVTAVALVSGVGMAFASSDAGTSLQSWYDAQFEKSASSIQKQTTKYATDKVPALAKEYNGLKTSASNSINTTRELSTGVADSKIKAAKKDHLDSLAAQRKAIEDHLKSQFDGIQQTADTIIGQVGEEAIKYANKDLTSYTGTAGSNALTQLNKDLTKASDDAVKELQDAIKDAKDDLQAELDSATNSRVATIKGIIDRKIEELRTTITAKKNELVVVQQGLITAKAQELQKAAEDALQAAVDGI